MPNACRGSFPIRIMTKGRAGFHLPSYIITSYMVGGENILGALQGCSVDFWRNNYALWVGYEPGDIFYENFERDALSTTLNFTTAINLDLRLHGIHGLVREALAALLNASHPGVQYPLSEEEVLDEFQRAYDLGGRHMDDQFVRFKTFNSLACPFC